VDSSIKFNVSANTAQFQSGMRQVDTVAKGTAAGIKSAFAGVGSMLVGGAIVSGLKSLMNDFDRVGKLASRFNTSAESIQRVSVAAQVAGTDVEAVANAMTKAGIAASKAVESGGQMADLFRRAGISARDFAAANVDEKLLMIAEAYRAAGTDASKTNAIIEIMGSRAGANLIPLISNLEALKAEMQGVSVASDDVVRKIEAANDRLTRLSNNMKVGFASVIGFITDTSERLGNALAGGAGHTIKELEEVEARYAAIAQLSYEGSRDFVTALATQDMAKQAAMIAERTEQILAKTRDIGQQMSISEETLDSSLGLEKEKTAELAKQAELLAKQEAQRQKAIKDIGAEVALIEAQLSGNKKLEESLREQADFQSALAKTDNFETASNFAAAKAAERAAQAANQGGGSGGGSGGGLRSASPRSALQRLEEMSQGGNAAARAALMRAEAEQARNLANTAALSERGLFGSAARQQIRSEERMQDRAMRELTKQTRNQFFGARNAGDAARNFERDAFKSGMTNKEAMDKMGIDRKLGESTRDALDRFAKEQAKTETERAKEQADMEQGGGGGGGGAVSTEPATEATLKRIFEKIQERPILVA
jgi:hypothetical protein